ncbi:hypothetical protein RclHR1_15500004 [Rhizophagus clarus]|uniref:GATA-type domain-containing protein n=1 Tax=Rhizophagus clarus TaxID=94130 RepID=A0A2Z6QH27_9GLOM|nr:hypothetical protein RclHR1_15500004 [Rhizophagus clarus]
MERGINFILLIITRKYFESMDYFSSTEVFGILYQVSFELERVDDGFYLSSLFYLDKYIVNACVDLVINEEVRYTVIPINFHGEVEIYKWYSISVFILSNHCIKNIILSIKNEYGLEVGSWKIYEDINYDVLRELDVSSTTPSTPLFYPSALSETLISPATSPNPNTTLVCRNCGVKETPLWRRKRMERYCNACCLYLKRNGINRKLVDNKVLRKERKKKSRSCAKCNTNSSPIWRNIDGKTYCNRHGLAELAKRKKQNRLSTRQ